MRSNYKNSKISRRDFIKQTSYFSAGACIGKKAGLFFGSPEEEKSNKPHIIMIMADQYRGDCVGCMGNAVIKTPHIDSIARDGVIFTKGYTAVSSCTPARAGLLTGQSPWHNGMLGYGRVAEKYNYELPRMVREGGYYTFGIGKMHWFPQKTLHGFHGTLVDESGRIESPDFVSDYRDWFKLHAPGLDPDATGIGWNEHRAGVYVLDENLHPTFWTGQTAVELIENYRLDKPLFLKVSFARPHSPYDPPQRFLDLYSQENMPAPFVGDWCGEFKDFPMTPNAAFGDFGVEHAKKSRRAYYGSISFIDEQVGKIIAALKKKGMYDNALVLFTADHGDMLGDHHHWRKTYAYEGSAHIPFLMKWPKNLETVIQRGLRLDYPVELRDILPTFLEVSGQNIPTDMDGDSLLKLVRERNPRWRDYIDMEHSTCYRPENYWCGLTDGKYKYIYHFYTGQEQLFDLTNDPGELHDLAQESTNQKRLQIWRGRMITHLSERGEEFVQDGKLKIRKEGMLYSPNYPGKS